MQALILRSTHNLLLHGVAIGRMAFLAIKRVKYSAEKIKYLAHVVPLVNAARLERATLGLKTRRSTVKLRAVKDARESHGR